jgi:hypothetical protein
MLRRVALVTTKFQMNVLPEARCVLRLLVTANGIPTLLILFTLMMEAISSPETSILTEGTRHHLPNDGILHLNLSSSLRARVYYYTHVGGGGILCCELAYKC